MGVLSMQVKSVGFLKGASLYSQAGFLATDMHEGMLTAPSARSSYIIGYNDTTPDKPDCVQTTSNCTPQQMANWNIHNWRSNVASLLPGGKGEIATVGEQIIIRIQFVVGVDEQGEKETKEYQLITGV